MKALPSAVQSALDSGATTFCRCWKVTLRDETVLGFTDHDRSLSFDGVDYEPASGFMASEVEASLGLAVDTQEVEGALSSDRIAEADIAAGLWDDAEVLLILVDWSDVAKRTILRRASIGEVTRGETAFRAELRGLAHRLAEDQGRAFARTCDAVLGDARCKVDLDTEGFTGEGTVAAVTSTRILRVSGLGAYDDGWFTGGVLTFLTGANAGRAAEVRRYQRIAGAPNLCELWQPMPEPVEAGDTFSISAGCDKTLATCKQKFGNVVNFRGFPHMPGNDFALSVARRNDVENDGGSMFNG